MKRIFNITCFLILPFFLNISYGQNTDGIQFISNLNWAAIKQRAKNENKYIFIDCFASWCGPCKAMDKNVYSSKSVGDIFNKNFISVKLQMDQTTNDNEYVKNWYKVAAEIQQEYSLPGYPSFLFFSPDGNLIHKGYGYKDPSDLIELGNNAIDSTKQYYALSKKYKSGKIIYPNDLMLYITVAKNNGDIKEAEKAASKFKEDYLDKLSIEKLLDADIINFICNYYWLVTSKDNFFKLSFLYPTKFDSIKPGGYANFIVKYVIENEEIDSKILVDSSSKKRNLNWDEITANITKLYGEKYADELVPPARKKLALSIGDWNEFAKLQDLEISKMKLRKDLNYINYSWNLNMAAWNTYLKCSDYSVLKKALKWSELSINLVSEKVPNPSEQYYDTKARLLYKLGRKSEAIENEQKAIDTGIQMAKISGGSKGVFYEDYSLVLNRMKNGESISDLK